MDLIQPVNLAMALLVVMIITSMTDSRPLDDEESQTSKCTAKQVAKYNLTVETFWSKDTFPKQYPLYRPNAQWSRLIGHTHNREHVMWRVGHEASPAVKEFAEKGTSTVMDQQVQGEDGILDSFNTRNIPVGLGHESVHIIMDPDRHMVSTMMKIIPSPDWFVGLDSIDLCRGGGWLDKITFDLGPVDAGTDKGFTFTSPNWQDVPQKPVSVITSSEPSHPANSFFYPEKESLPRLATITFSRVQLDVDDFTKKSQNEEQSSGSVADVQLEDPNSGGAFKTETDIEESNSESKTIKNVSGKNLKHQQAVLSWEHQNDDPKLVADDSTPTTTTVTRRPAKSKVSTRKRNHGKREGVKADERKMRKHRKKTQKNKRPKNNRRRKGPKTPVSVGAVDCKVSEWSDWGACSKTCGFGNQVRMRTVITQPENGGHVCPSITEEIVCGSMRNCGWEHFKFNWE